MLQIHVYNRRVTERRNEHIQFERKLINTMKCTRMDTLWNLRDAQVCILQTITTFTHKKYRNLSTYKNDCFAWTKIMMPGTYQILGTSDICTHPLTNSNSSIANNECKPIRCSNWLCHGYIKQADIWKNNSCIRQQRGLLKCRVANNKIL